MSQDTLSETFIQQEVPVDVRALFPQRFQSAYDAVDALTREYRFLQTPTAKYTKGHLIALAVEHGLQALIDSGKWSVRDYSYVSYTKPTGKYLRIETQNSIVTISQLQQRRRQPRKATFRQNAKFNNAPFLNFIEFPGPLEEGTVPHLIIGHGYQTLTFVQVGIPHPEHKHEWLALTRNAFDELREVTSDLVPEEAPNVEATLELKEAVKKRIQDNG